MKNPRKGDDIADRLMRFAANVLWICRFLPSTVEGRHIRKQLTAAGTSPGANYEEARCAESRADFVHKIRTANKEMRESKYWLGLARLARFVPPKPASKLVAEADELVAILTKSSKTAKRGSNV